MMQQEEEMNQEVPTGMFGRGKLGPVRPTLVPLTCPPLSSTTSVFHKALSPTCPTSVLPERGCKTGSSNGACSPATTPGLDNNWQANKPSVRERNAAMFNNELMADVHFVVGQGPGTVRLPAHKYVLATGSSVFYAMFYGQLADIGNDIQIPDVEPPAFLNLLK